MIAIAGGLLGNLETTNAVVKKDGASIGFAAAFEEVSRKDAATSGGAKGRAAVLEQGRRVAGGNSAAVAAGKGAIAKAAGGDVAAESAVAELKVVGEVGSTAVPDTSAATKAASAARPVAANVTEAGAVGQETLAGREILAGGPSDGEAVPPGQFVRSSKAPESQGSTSGAGAVVLGSSTILPVVARATSEIEINGLEASARSIAGSADALSTGGDATVQAVAAAVPDLDTPGGNPASGDLKSLVGPLEARVGTSGLVAAKGAKPSASIAEAPAPGQTPGAARGSGVVVPAQVNDGTSELHASVATPGLQEALVTAGEVGQPGVTATASVPAKVVESHQPAVPSARVAGATARALGPVVAPVVADDAVGPQKISPQAVTPQAVISLPGIGQQTAGQATSAQQNRVQTEDIAPGFAAPVAGTELGTSQPPQQAGVLKTGSQQVQNWQGRTPQAGAQQLTISEDRASGEKPDQGVIVSTVAAKNADKPVIGEKGKKATGVATTSSNSGKTVIGGALDHSSDARGGLAPNAADASAAAVLVSLPLVSSPATAAERANETAGRLGGTTPSTAAFPTGNAAASSSKGNVAGNQAGLPVVAQNSAATLQRSSVTGQAATQDGSANPDAVRGAQEATAPVIAAVNAEVAAPQVGHVAARVTPVGTERTSVQGKATERTAAETTANAQPIPSQHLPAAVPETAKSSNGAHPTPSEADPQNLTTGAAGLGGGIGAASLSATQVVTQVATHGVVAPNTSATTAASGTQSPSITSGTVGLASAGVAGTETLLSPLTHTTLQATPTVLEVGVPGGTHGWLKIRAEIGEGGTVQASMSAATHEGQETLRRELPAMNAFLDSEHVPVSVQVASHGLSSANMSSTASAGVLGGDTSFNLGSGLSQDAGQGRSEAGTGLLAGGDGARQESGEGSQDGNRTIAANAPASMRGEVSAETDWVSRANADSGLGYGSGISVNGGSWLNVIA